ncbi:MAG TPA: hypothetical protein VIC05_01500 [Solirubrobacteraceae bacterium]
MSDEPISDNEPSPGQPPAPGPEEPHAGEQPANGNEVSSTLAALEQKLRDLEHELSAMDSVVVARSDDAPSVYEPGAEEPPAQTSIPPESQAPAGAAHLIDESLLGQAEPAQPTPPPQAEHPAAGQGAEQQAAAAELLRFHGHLQRLTQALCDEYDKLLGRLGLGAEATPPPHKPAARGEHEQTEDEELFTGHVELGVGPFFEIAALSAFERDLAQLSNVTATAVRRFEASHAVIDLELTAPTALVSELKTIVGGQLRVRQIAGNRLALTFDEA